MLAEMWIIRRFEEKCGEIYTAGKIAGLGRVHIGDSLDDGSGDGVISGVLEESGLILVPDGTPVNVKHSG